MTAPLPSNKQPIATISGGNAFITMVWQRWFNSFTASAGNAVPITLNVSPYAQRFNVAGDVLVRGGTVSAVSITRGSVTMDTGQTSGFYPVSIGDTIAITYSVAPTVTFIPR